MGFFRKKKDSEKAHLDRELIDDNTGAMDALIILAEQNKEHAELVEEFKRIKEQIKYLIASEDDKVRDYDKKIRNAIDDLRIEMVKGDSEMSSKASKLLLQLKLTIADRNAKL